jgi:hypothetical protein
MMSELVERLRDGDRVADERSRFEMREAADEIERLTRELGRACEDWRVAFGEVERLRARPVTRGVSVGERLPKPHTRYAVIRNSEVFTATPCYGMHEPWWVVRTMADEHPFEADPVAMEPDDLWWPIVEFVEAAKAGGDDDTELHERT